MEEELSIENIGRSLNENKKLTEKLSDLEEKYKISEQENADLKNELNFWKVEFEKLQEKLMKEIERHKNVEVEKIKEAQDNRKRGMSNLQKPQANDVGVEYEKLKKEYKKVEEKYTKLKREFNEEKEFLEAEVKKGEENANENKNKFIIALNERDYYESIYNSLVEELKKQKINVEDGKIITNKKISKFLICSCK